MKFKTLLSSLALVSAVISTSALANETLTVAATPVPHAEILEYVKPVLAKEGIDLDVKIFNDYIQPNQQVEEKNLDANFFQHAPYLDSFNKDRGSHLVSVAGIHIEPFGAYSKKITKLSDLKEGATVALPNDATNGGRALLLLQKAGIIKLKDPKNLASTSRDIVENPKKLVFKEMEAAMLPRVIDEVDLALINTNFALEAGLNPTKDALVIEDKDSPYVNILVVHQGDEKLPKIQKLIKALQSEDVKNFILQKYKGAIVPAF